MLEEIHQGVVSGLIDADNKRDIPTRFALKRVLDTYPNLVSASNLLTIQPELLRSNTFDPEAYVSEGSIGYFKYGEHITEGICWLAVLSTFTSAVLHEDPQVMARRIAEITLSNGPDELKALNQSLPLESRLEPDDNDGNISSFVDLNGGGLRRSRFIEPEISKTMPFLQLLLNSNELPIKLGYHSFESIKSLSDFLTIVSNYGIRRTGVVLSTQITDNIDDKNDEGHAIGILGLKRTKKNEKKMAIYDINASGIVYLSPDQVEELMSGDEGLPYGIRNDREVFIRAVRQIPMRLISALTS